jgi:gliding motility-associated protein GldE
LDTSIDDPFPAIFLIILAIQGPVLFYLISGLALITLLFLSAMISGSEVAFFSLGPREILQLKEEHPHKKGINQLVSKPKRLLATILILNNFVNIAFVTLSTFVIWRIVGTNEIKGVIIVALTAIVTFALVYFGEVVPKIYANQKSIRFVRFSFPLIYRAFKFFKPLAWMLTSFSNIIEKRIKQEGYEISAEELKHALELTTSSDIPEEETGILKGIVNFGQLNVKQIMTSRVDMTAFDVEMNFHQLMDVINKTGYSRFPVYRETIDSIQGILYNKDLLPFLEKKENFKWQKLIRKPFFVPETKKIDTLLKDFQDMHVHMAIVADEYGGTSGLVTLEDVIEEIVGEIRDEFDDDEINFSKINDNTYIFEGKTTLIDFCKITHQDPDIFDSVKGESESLGGLILELSSKFPRAGEKIEFKNFVFTVVALDQKRIKRIRVLIK